MIVQQKTISECKFSIILLACKNQLLQAKLQDCSGSPGNERAGDNQNHLNDLNDELALLIGIERLDQLFYLYYIGIIHSPIVIKNKNKNEFVLKHTI